MYFIKSLPSTPSANDDDDSQGLLQTAITESTKLLPWVIDGKKQIKAYLKVCCAALAVTPRCAD
jgi:nucleolar complex protein 2